MLFHTHLLLGVVSYMLLGDTLPGRPLAVFLLILLGCLLPDIDEQRSKVAQWSGFFGKTISFFFRHRGIFHSLTLALFLSGLFFVWQGNFYYTLAFLVGYSTHLAGDALTPLGIRPFYPFSRARLRGPIRTSGILEGVIFLLLLLWLFKKIW